MVHYHLVTALITIGYRRGGNAPYRGPPSPAGELRSIRRRGHDTRPCPEFDAMHERYCDDSLNGVCAPRRGRMLACQVRRSATWVTRPWAFRGRFISRAMW